MFRKKKKDQLKKTDQSSTQLQEPQRKFVVESDSDSDADASLNNNENFASRWQEVKSKTFTEPADHDSKTRSRRNGSLSRRNNRGSGTISSKISQSVSHLDQIGKDISWPFLDTHDFCLACQTCFFKKTDGIGGYEYRPDLQHPCRYDYLLVKKIDHSIWLKVRPLFSGGYDLYEFRLCWQFQNRMPCRTGEAKCTFCHNHLEKMLWKKEQAHAFNIAGFIKEAKAQGLYSSAILRKQLEGSTTTVDQKVQYVPDPGDFVKFQHNITSPQASHESPGAVQIEPLDLTHPPPLGIKNQPPSPGKAATSTFQAQTSPNFTTSHITSQPPPIQTSSYQIPNPLPEYNYKLCCSICLLLTEQPWHYIYMAREHECSKIWLVYEIENERYEKVWVRIRDRASHRTFKGNYVLCNSVRSKSFSQCNRLETCSFAHNTLEQKLWKMEQMEQFDIGDFIFQNRPQQKLSTSKHHVQSVQFLMNKFHGYFRFICRACYFSVPSMLSSKGGANICTGKKQHIWSESRCIAHILNTRCTPIDERKFLSKSAFYIRCSQLQFCLQWIHNRCKFAHSDVERHVWMAERDNNISREDLVSISFDIYQGQLHPPSPNLVSGDSTDSAGAAFAASKDGVHGSSQIPPLKITPICQTCKGNGQQSVEESNKDRCVRGHNNFKAKSVYIALPSSKIIRSPPSHVFPGTPLKLCYSMSNCKHPLCTFAHSQEELAIWNWMRANKIKSLLEVQTLYMEAEKSRTRTINAGESVVSLDSGSSVLKQPQARTKLTSHITPGDLVLNEYYCRYCETNCNGKNQWDEHCTSQKHVSNVNSDSEQQWNFRQPPWGQGKNLMLCAKHMANRSCQFSYVPDMYNLCKYAHNQEELEEWRERYEWRQMKRLQAQENASYTDALLQEFYSKDDSVNVISEDLAGVFVSCDNELILYKNAKGTILTWTFQVSCKVKLKRVALLYNKGRLHFSLKDVNGAKCQIASGDLFQVDKADSTNYTVKVNFIAGMFGSFHQWLVFDFGSRPVLVRKLMVEVGEPIQLEQVKEIRENLAVERWTSQNRDIVRKDKLVTDEFTNKLLARYKDPTASESVVTLDIQKDLNQHNYVHKMHNLLELEEITRHSIIASCNLITDVSILASIEETGIMLCASEGQVFLKVDLTGCMTEDTVEGKLVIESVGSVLFKPVSSTDNKVYEADIVGEDNFGFDGRFKDYLYVAVTANIAKALCLVPKARVMLEVQFQMDRRFFCRMHYTLDCLKTTDVVFPDIAKFKPNIDQLTSLKLRSNLLNEDQMSAIRHIVVVGQEDHTPPFIMYGPFGTGKTETLMQAAMVLLKKNASLRILICTQSNSASDLYITKHLDTFVTKMSSRGIKLQMLRLMAVERRKSTVSSIVRKYCCLDESGRFYTPPAKYVRQCQIVLVTVENSVELTRLGLHDNFTHIFMDEAGQTLECQILMPISLASVRTCVVLAGDHKQIGPVVYSDEARRQKFDVSILVRLYNYYTEIVNCGYPQLSRIAEQSPLTTFLSINYRTKAEILRLISSIFYGGPENLKAHGNIPSVVEITPITLFAVQGEEVQNKDSVSFSNSAEAQEVVGRVKDLLHTWPEEWGPPEPEKVVVITPYSDQSKLIRLLLRRDRLNQVCVGSIQQYQGQEFRAVFISTVRTTHLLKAPHIVDALNTGKDIGDLGFLSNPKLINTALTRAQSFVGVVGDPCSLCLIGECTTIWRTYLKHCTNMKSVHPPNYNYDMVRNQVVQLQYSSVSKVVEQISKRGQEQARRSRSTQKQTGVAGTQPSQKPVDKSPKKVNTHGEPFENSNKVAGLNESSIGQNTPAETQPSQPMKSPKEIRTHREPHVDSNKVTELKKSLSGPSKKNDKTEMLSKFTGDHLSGEDQNDSKMNDLSKSPQQHPHKGRLKPLSQHGAVKGLTRRFTDEDRALSSELSAEDVVFRLAKESCAAGGDNDCVLSEGISVHEIKNFSVLKYSMDKTIKQERFKIASDSEDFVAFSVVDKDSGIKKLYENWGPERLKAALHEDPEKYFKCTFHIEGEVAYARVIASHFTQKFAGNENPDIVVSGSHNRGHAFGGDTVVVEVTGQSKMGKLLGQVKGVLKRTLEPSNRLFVCTAVWDEPGILTPINSDIPRMYCLISSHHLDTVESGNVCVYKCDPIMGLTFSHYEPVDPTGLTERLFVVRYLMWQPGFSLPMGVAVAVLEPTDSVNRGMKALEVEYNIRHSLQPKAQEEAQLLIQEDFLAQKVILTGRKDLTSSYCFTVGGETEEDLEMAVSIFEINDTYQIGMHVTDVAAFIEQHSLLDLECEQRGASFFPLGSEPIHMLPVELCTNFCSLKPDFHRLAVSVMIKVDKNGECVGKPEVFRSVIKSKQRLTHSEVETILMNPEDAESDFMSSCITVLYQLSYLWRCQRLGNGHFSNVDIEPDQLEDQHSHLLMNELKIRFNTVVADILLLKFKNSTPLLVQPSPDPWLLENWKRSHAGHALNSIPLTKAFLKDEVCRCRSACTCVYGYIHENSVSTPMGLSMLKDQWIQLEQCVSEDIQDFELAQALISNTENKPQVALAAHKFHSIQQNEMYVISQKVLPKDRKHYMLSVKAFTNWTNPMRRFISLVIQRFLIAYIENGTSPYSDLEMEEICAQATAIERVVEKFHRAVFMLHLTFALRARPLTLNGQVEEVCNENALVKVSGVRDIPPCMRTVQLHLLSPGRTAVSQQSASSVHLQWEDRVYLHTGILGESPHCDSVTLDEGRLDCLIPKSLWQSLLRAARKEDEADMASCIQIISQHLKHQMTRVCPEVLCGVGSDGSMKHFLPIFFSLTEGQSLQVQISASSTKDFMSPQLQLVSLTPRLDICVEHRTHPAFCFSFLTTLSECTAAISPHSVRDLLPVLAVESCECAVAEGERLTIHNIHIRWTSRIVGDKENTVTEGEFGLSDEFCTRCSFEPDFGNTLALTLLDGQPMHKDPSFCLAYLCVRYTHLMTPEEPALEESVSALVNNGQPVTWVGHCTITGVTRCDQGYRVKVLLVQSGMKIPSTLLLEKGDSIPCTVEWIQKSSSQRLIDICARGLHCASQFAQDVFSGQKSLTNTIGKTLKKNSLSKSLWSSDQEKIIRESYSEPLTVIHGGPGTGKSLCAARLGHLFVERNHLGQTTDSQGQQLMICAPTEQSLDTIAVFLKLLNVSNVTIVRVYSEEVEEQDFLRPGLTKRVQQDSLWPVMKDIALHHLIRSKGNPHSKALLDCELELTMYEDPQFITSLIHAQEQAQKYQLRNAQVILCTCITSGRTVMHKFTNVKQIIVDDAGLVSETELLVPLVLHKMVNQLILLGDQHMPGPHIRSSLAAKLGLSRSCLHLSKKQPLCLTSHFRNALNTCSFPTSWFYQDKLTLDPNAAVPCPSQSLVWPGDVPTVFCHLDSVEANTDLHDDLVVNEQEALFVAQLVDTLIKLHSVKATSIHVLTMSKGQAIYLKTILPADLIVSTVLESLGRESEYVILSTVRTLPPGDIQHPSTSMWKKKYLGQAADPSLLNLALTRATVALFIVGNKTLLGVCDSWNSLLAWYREKKSLVNDSSLFLELLSLK